MKAKIAAACIIFCSTLSVCPPARAETAREPKLRILVPQSTSALPFLLIEKENTFPAAAVTVDTFINHPQALALLLRGEADMLLTGTSQGWENRLDGSPIVMADTGVWGMSSLVGKDRGIKGFADLKGRKIALPFPGSPLDFQTRAILAKEKLDPDRDVTISYGAFTQSLPKLIAGQLDAVALPEPQATQVVRDRGLLRLSTYTDAWARASGGDGKSPQVSLFVTEAFARSQGPLVAALIEAWRKAAEAVERDPSRIAALFASALSTDSGVLAEAIGHTFYAVPSFAQNKALVIAYYAEVLPYFPGVKRPLDDGFFFLP